MYDILAIEGRPPQTQVETLEALREWGFPVNEWCRPARDVDEVLRFHSEMEESRDDLTFERVALWPEQARDRQLPPNDVKITDKNTPKYVAEYGEDCWELDAIHPDQLIPMIQKAITANLNMAEFRRQQRQEQEDRAPIAAVREIVVEAFPD